MSWSILSRVRLEAGLTDSLDARVLDRPPARLRIGLLVPQQGALAMLAPSVLDAALLAAHELNVAGGVRGAFVDLVPVDSGAEASAVAAETRALVAAGAVDAVVSFCASDVHLAVAQGIAGHTPYVYTPPHEGGPVHGSSVCIGPRPGDQLRAAIDWLTRAHGLRRWALVGSDYVWPWATHRAARGLLRHRGGSVVLDEFVPLGAPSGTIERIVGRLSSTRADAVIVSLVGRDQMVLHRAMQRVGLDRHVVRLSGALEENALLALGGDRTGLLYAAMPSFASMTDETHLGLLERHAAVLGRHAPILDSYAEATYDGLMLVAQVAAHGGLRPDSFARTAQHVRRDSRPRPAQLARADGLELAVVPGLA